MIRSLSFSCSLICHFGQVRHYSREAFSFTKPEYFWKKSDFENVDRWVRRKYIELNRNDFLKLSFESPLLNRGACQRAIFDAVSLGRSESLRLIFQGISGSFNDDNDDFVVQEALIQTIIHLQPECLETLLNSRSISKEMLHEVFVVLSLYHKDAMGESFKDVAESAWRTCKAFYKASVPMLRITLQGEDPNHSSNRDPLIDLEIAKQATEGKVILLKERMDRFIRVKSLLEGSPYARPSLIAQARIEAMARRGS